MAMVLWAAVMADIDEWSEPCHVSIGAQKSQNNLLRSLHLRMQAEEQQ